MPSCCTEEEKREGRSAASLYEWEGGENDATRCVYLMNRLYPMNNERHSNIQRLESLNRNKGHLHIESCRFRGRIFVKSQFLSGDTKPVAGGIPHPNLPHARGGSRKAIAGFPILEISLLEILIWVQIWLSGSETL